MNEKEIIQGCQRSEVSSQHRLFLTYSGKLMSVCRRYAQDGQEAEDILQEAFIQIFKNIHQFAFTGSFEGWIRRVTVNTAIRFLQQRKIRFTEITSQQNELASSDPGILADMGTEDLLRLIEKLPDGYRTIFNLFVMEGFSHEEIAKMMKIKPATSRSQLSKARSMLKEQIISLQKIPG